MRASVGSDTIAAGDTLALTVFENVKDDPLLGNTGQRVSLLDQVQVDGQGYIFVPYAGKIKAAGQTPDGLRQAITRKLDAQTPDPQVTVQRLAGDGSSVTVSGAVTGQGVYPIERPTRTLSACWPRLAASGSNRKSPLSA
jgi:polysaccharide biosynthesis/export protein